MGEEGGFDLYWLVLDASGQKFDDPNYFLCLGKHTMEIWTGTVSTVPYLNLSCFQVTSSTFSCTVFPVHNTFGPLVGIIVGAAHFDYQR